MKPPLRSVLGSLWFIHLLVFLGMGAVFGCVMLKQKLLLLGVALSFAGAVCGAFIRVLDALGVKARA